MKINCRINHAASCLFKVLAVGLLLTMFTSASLAFNLTWTNGNDTWTSTTAWQTNVFNIVTNNYTYWYTNGATTWTTNFCTLTNGIVPFAGNINIISNCTPGGVDTACAATPPLPGFGLGDACAGGTGAAPGLGDQAIITNAGPNTITVSGSPSVGDLTVNSNAVVTLDATGNSLTVTNVVLIGNGAGANAKLYWAGGTLDNDSSDGFGRGQVRIGDNGGNGELIVTNGTFVYDWRGGGIALSVGANSFSTGKLVVAGSGVVTPDFSTFGGTLTIGNGGSCQGSSLIVSNGGQLFASRFNVGSGSNSSGPSNKNNWALITGANSVCSNVLGLETKGVGNWLIVSNGAKLFSNGGSLGSDASWSTTIVTRASWFSSGTTPHIRVGRGSSGASNNCLTVYDGGYVSCAGTLSIGDSSLNYNNVLRLGGTGLMSTGDVAGMVRAGDTATFTQWYVTNAVLNCGTFNVNGSYATLHVLPLGTIVCSNLFQFNRTNHTGIVDGGTIVSSNMSVGGTAGIGHLFAITNGGKVISQTGTFGGGFGSHTGLVSGAGSVWSNYAVLGGSRTFTITGSNSYFVVSSDGALFNDGTFNIANSNNYFAVVGGARLDNTGTFNIGSTSSNGLSFCQVVFGGPGAPAIINNSGNLKIGTGTAATGNQLTVSNATLNAGTVNVGGTDESRINNSLTFLGGAISTALLQVRTSNTFTFSSGLLSVGATDFRTGANTNDGSAAPLVAGDGVNAAYYDLAAGGSGRHDFNSGGLVATNAAFLRGEGNLVGNVTVLGTFVPGTAGTVGTIVASNNLTFGSSAVLEYDLGTSSDTVTVLGDLALGGAVNVTSNAGFTSTTYTLFTHTGTVSGVLSVGTMPAGYTGTISNDLPNTPTILLVVTPTGGGDPYTTWVSTYGLSGGDALGAADPDGDGMSNTNEFLVGFNPTNSTARLRVISIAKSGSDMNVTYLGANGDSSGSPGPKTNVLEFTTGTGNGSYTNNFTSTGQTNELSGGTGSGVVTNMIDVGGATGPARYYRVRVLVP